MSTPTIDLPDLVHRLTALERSNRRLKWVVVFLAAGCLVVAFMVLWQWLMISGGTVSFSLLEAEKITIHAGQG